MTIIQIILVAFAAFALSRVVLNFRKGRLSAKALVGWTIFWIGTAVIVLRPETASALARFLGVGRGADVIVYLAVVIAFYLLFRLFGRIEALERQITKMVRALALRDADLNDDGHGKT